MTQVPPVNSLVHHEYISNDPEATKAFFSKVFGWQIADVMPEYAMGEIPGGTAVGIRKPEGPETAGVLNYVLVKNLANAVKDAKAAGAHVVVERQEVPEMGAMAVYIVPGGIAQGIWEPAPSK